MSWHPSFKLIGLIYLSFIGGCTYLLFFDGSCQNSVTPKSKIEQEARKDSLKRELHEHQKNDTISKLVSKYKINFMWDTLQYYFSIDFEEVINSKTQLIDDPEIIDIFMKDSIEYVSIKTFSQPHFYFDFPISSEQEKMLARLNSEIILVVSISEVKKIGHSKDFSGKGKIIEIVNF